MMGEMGRKAANYPSRENSGGGPVAPLTWKGDGEEEKNNDAFFAGGACRR